MAAPLATIRSFLLARSAITDEVGTRITVGTRKPSETLTWQTPEDVEKSILVNSGRGDDILPGSGLFDGEIELMCLANSSAAAETLAWIIIADIKTLENGAHVTVGSNEIIGATIEEAPTVEQDPKTDWNFARLSVQFKIG